MPASGSETLRLRREEAPFAGNIPGNALRHAGFGF